MSTTTTHPYFTAKAREVFYRAGGDPDLSGPLAAWAEEARNINDPHRGVVVAEDGEILATTFLARSPGGVSAWYIDAEAVKRYRTDLSVVDMAMGRITYATGKRAVHITMSDVCTGAGKHIQDVPSGPRATVAHRPESCRHCAFLGEACGRPTCGQ